MVFGSDWRGGDPLTPKEMEGRAFTAEELRTVTVLPSQSRFEAVNDADTCEPCKARNGKRFTEGDPIDHPECESPNGCRCVVANDPGGRCSVKLAALRAIPLDSLRLNTARRAPKA